mmetsp:Transcript_16321/g.35516  ORF Transcript_16321/g.35516 Transcript_16321/m.35516 type:complete len:596 (-) Transcript_16321:332-2119(-)|eukprot:CAMPEP_0172555198 /NCGR_PEP_ID=MMETSP1067-20121228/58293_1 /TAXON_ID=265564 ORGANISM="Thalassiosira punctigera, Strain Tpunct2005C2" /NCGR_SAMPLE_ID=MMETSP1067 /ASSEMBLY_ACC=CAM_ASM_000444 /LENGTH=595 /DNA_ID=CAMNT_0013343711 /DNA_START=27 /DNA_END=1814 /DNA_ORIENTATION=-
MAGLDQDIASPLLTENSATAPSTLDDTFASGGGVDVKINSNGRALSKSSIRVANSLVLSSKTRAREDDFDEDEGRERKGCCSKFCTLMDTWPVTFVLVAALLGIGIGIGLSLWSPEDSGAKDVTVRWIGLLGELFIRALKCIVLPLVFVSIAVSVMDMLSLGEAGTIVGVTIGLYVCTTICAAIIGVLSSVIFSRYYVLQGVEDVANVAANVRLGCANQNGAIESYLTEQADGSVMCLDEPMSGLDNSTVFLMEDVNNYFAKSPSAGEPAKLTLSESVYQGLFLQLIDDNMVGMFVKNNFLGVIILGAGFGVALNQLAKKMPPGVNWDKVLLIQILEELMQVFMFFIHWIIRCTPFAIISLIAKAIGQQNDIGSVFEQLGYLVAATVVALAVQVSVIYPSLYTLAVKANPFAYLKQMVPAQMMAFASASSAATIPASIECATSTGLVPDGVARFCIPLGATANMDGGAIYIITASVWLAYQNGIVPSASDYVLLVICATLGSMGAAPVPSAVLVLVLTSYNTTFGAPSHGGAPAGLSYLFAIDWLLDRLRTMTNVTGDLTVTGVVSSKVNDEQAERLGNAANESGNKQSQTTTNV